MEYDAQKHHRRSIRLKGYDYSQVGAYFITICTQDHACLFGEISGEEMQLNGAGHMVMAGWKTLSRRFPIVTLDEFVVMPNHVHGILLISDIADRNASPLLTGQEEPYASPLFSPAFSGISINSGTAVGANPCAHRCSPDAPEPEFLHTRPDVRSGANLKRTVTVGDVVGAFKSLTTVSYVRGTKEQAWPSFHTRLWQRNYHEHIVRNEALLHRVRQYVFDNPAQWSVDRHNPQAVPSKLNEPWAL